MKKILFASLLIYSFVGFSQTELARPDIPGQIMVDVGLNFWDVEPSTLEQRAFPSKSLGIYYVKRKALGNKFSFYYGIGLGMEKFSLGDSSTFRNSVDTLIIPTNTAISDFAAVSFDKNRLAVTYLDIPLDFRFHPKGTEDGEGFFVGVGAILGVRLTSHTKWKYDQGEETLITKNKGPFNLNSVRYGVQGRLGFRGIHVFYKKYFSNVFDAAIGGANPANTTIGINVTGF